jgi:hypothetical protein
VEGACTDRGRRRDGTAHVSTEETRPAASAAWNPSMVCPDGRVHPGVPGRPEIVVDPGFAVDPVHCNTPFSATEPGSTAEKLRVPHG